MYVVLPHLIGIAIDMKYIILLYAKHAVTSVRTLTYNTLVGLVAFEVNYPAFDRS